MAINGLSRHIRPLCTPRIQTLVISLVFCLTLSTMASADSEVLPMNSNALPIEQGLQQQLLHALRDKGESYQPRTHHLTNDQQPVFTNRLILESSPYLLQHAHNPVNWYAWGEEALQQAKTENKPIFISIGYSTCHWCHVMERESFENLAIARFLNQHFISIKVDREQRPDLDDIFMTAAQLISGHGGWPLNAFLTSEGKPFFAATYFPPAQFQGLISEVSQAWQADKRKIVSQAERIHTTIEATMAPRKGEGLPTQISVQKALDHFLNQYDEFNGGFSNAPKFPQETVLLLILEQAQQQRDESLLGTVIHTLDAMQQGGIYDQVGGGFHRYATDPEWLVPHFEKMLYNQALLSEVYLRAWQLTNNPLHKRTLEHTLEYVLREMHADNGGFYSATDADSEGEEGRFFIWSVSEFNQALDTDDRALAQHLFGISAAGNFEGENILHLETSLPEFADTHKLPYNTLLSRVDRFREQLYQARKQREHPLLDDKIITSWNAMMLRSLALAGYQLRNPRYLAAAWQSGEYLWQHHRDSEGIVWRDLRHNKPGVIGTQEDYAALGRAMLALYDTSLDPIWLSRGQQITDQMIERFWDNDQGGFFLSAVDALTPLRGRSLDDGATPSATALGDALLKELSQRSGDSRYQDRANQLLQNISSRIEQYPASFSYLLSQYSQQLNTELSAIQYAANGALRAELVAKEDGFLLKVRLRDGWHINAEIPGDKRLIGAQVSGTGIDQIRYPDSTDLSVQFSQNAIGVYSGEFEIGGQQTTQDGLLPPRLMFQFQACSDRICLPPERLVMQIPATH